MWKLYLVRCETAFVFCFLREKWIIVYRLLQRHWCRWGTWSGLLQCAEMELFVAIQFLRRIYECWFWDSFSDTSWTANLVFCFWTIYRGLSWISPGTCAHRQLSCRSFSRAFLIFDVVCCFFLGFLMFNEGWFLCIAIIMTSDFLLDLMFYGSFDGIVFCRSSHWNFLRCGELSF